MKRRRPKPIVRHRAKPVLPPPSAEERAKAAEAARQLRRVAAGEMSPGNRTVTHVDFARPRGAVWIVTWENLPGFRHEAGYFRHELLPGWAYTKAEVRAEMIPDLERLAETGERPTEATR